MEDEILELKKPTKPQTVYETVEISRPDHLILKLDDGRHFAVVMSKPLGEDEPLPTKAEISLENLDETGCPQGAKFKRFVV